MRAVGVMLGTLNPQTLSGGDRYAFGVLAAWARDAKAEVTLAVSAAGAAVAARYGYALETVVVTTDSAIGAMRLGYMRRLAAGLGWARRERPGADIVFCASAYSYDVLPALLYARRSRAAGTAPRLVVPVFHLVPPPWRRPGRLAINVLASIEQRIALAIVARCSDVVVVDNSDLVRELERRYSALGGKCFSTVMGLDPAIARVPSTDDAGPQAIPARYALCVGRRSAAKGLPALLDAWRVVAAACPDLTLALVGAPDPAFDLDAEVRRRGLESAVVAYSGVDDAAVAVLRERAEFGISGSREEGYGLAIMEALAAGLPCVTYDLAPFREAFPAGRVVADGEDAASLAGAALALAGDPARRARLRDEIAAFYRFPTWECVAGRLWDRVIGSGAS